MHGLDESDAERILTCLRRLGFDLCHPLLEDPDGLFAGLEEFRQHLGGRLTLTMIPQIGRSFEVHEIDRARMRKAAERLRQYAASPADR